MLYHNQTYAMMKINSVIENLMTNEKGKYQKIKTLPLDQQRLHQLPFHPPGTY